METLRKGNNGYRFTTLLLLIALMTLVPVPATLAQEASNRLVIIVDGSGSFKARQAEAVGQTVNLLESMAQTKTHRWESQSDLITIIALDAMPEVIWKGSMRDLKAVGRNQWAERFAARRDLSWCTDVKEAFLIAARELEGDPRYVSKYLFVFSDLVHEPPISSVRKCRSPLCTPPEGFPWEALSDVSVAIFWLPPDQKLIWERAARERGLGATFALFTTSQSGAEKIRPPSRPTRKITEQEQERLRGDIADAGKRFGTWIVYGVGGIVGLALIVLILGKLLARGRQHASHAAPGRPFPQSRLHRPVARPMPVRAIRAIRPTANQHQGPHQP